MSTKFKFTAPGAMYFVTGTVVEWADVFTRNVYKDILLDSIRFCQKNQQLQIHAWVLMTNHFHLICSTKEDGDLGLILKNMKSFTATRIIDAIINNESESRRKWLMDIFERNGQTKRGNLRFQFWQHENHPILLDNQGMFDSRLNYLHDNPVRAGFVSDPKEWLYSSARDYYGNGDRGLLELVIIG